MCRRLLCATLLLVTGCTGGGPTLPRTHPAGGSLRYQDGKPAAGASIQFNSATDPLLRIIGTAGDDGAFTLTTVKDAAQADGAPEGDYKVIISLPLANDPRGNAPAGHKGVPPIVLDKTYRVEAKDNTFKIDLPIASPKR
jgi:hypothetical protein